MELSLSLALALRLREEAVAAFPEECCGLLIGRQSGGTCQVTDAVASPNLAADRRRFFEIDPALHIAWLRRLREAGGVLAVIGHYHSHPSGASRPSPRDLAAASDADALWLIIGGPHGGAELAAWRPVFADGQAAAFAPVSLNMAEPAGD